ncbi:NAD-dependent malic enzyme [Methylophaga thiooxydans]|uniref:malate dehydrogenase (oxaloacetate-decarboxylating) n=1 Tax=Methylophaga thiooxydans TaxID=392484 RepID=A0A0A0BIP5_9GAMM|nr:NAD-dependent malic enzyme [Methylophaga thiooxydans]KGM06994.1 NAD-dependent malic enzyme [Methylophaga thiooxydans]
MNADVSQDPIYIPFTGPTLTSVPILNKGTAFSEQERHDFNLIGLIPHRFETIEQQAERAYLQYCSFDEPINKHIYLRTIQDTNETLFYYLLQQHLAEMMPIIYTPTVGEACERFSQIYRRARGLFIAYPERHHIDEILHNATKQHVKVIVVTDGSRILGLGDQGAGGMGIPIGKLSLYTACAGISPAYTLPIMLDVGTDNDTLLNNPMYMGWKNPRISSEEYDDFIELFVRAMEKRWPGVLLQFEDFEQQKALPLLERYQDEVCCFNDDIQGTAAVAVGSLIAACKVKNEQLSQQTVVFAGAGSAGCGIAEQMVRQMCVEGLSEAQARARIFMVDRQGLLTTSMTGLYDFQQRLAQKPSTGTETPATISLQQVVELAKPTVLIGVSGQAGLFSENVVKTMHAHCHHPIIFPLSNPSKQVEALPQDLIEWTQGQALIATGSPFKPVQFNGQEYVISQCNNSYIFPGIGLAVVAAGITRVTNEMMMVASEVLAAHSPLLNSEEAALLPPLESITTLSKEIAFYVAKSAQKAGLAIETSEPVLRANIAEHFWQPRYRDYRRRSV